MPCRKKNKFRKQKKKKGPEELAAYYNKLYHEH